MSSLYDAACDVCRRVLCPTASDPELYGHPEDGFAFVGSQTYEAFQEAAKQGCPICCAASAGIARHDTLRSSLELSPSYFRPNKYQAVRLQKDDKRFRPLKPEEEATGELSTVLHVSSHDPGSEEDIEIARICLVPAGEGSEAAKFSSLPINVSTGSATTLQAARGWLSHCRLNHERCNRPQRVSEGWCPKRLIDLGEPNSLSWKLCVVAEDGLASESASYLTLSYRWAPNPECTLTQNNMTQLRHGSAIRDLPRLFRNVVAVARQLDIRYLWIDALCIIQDSQADWENEAQTMQHVYANSACTISASAAKGPHESIFRRRDPHTLRPSFLESSLFQFEAYPHHMLTTDYWEREIDGPLRDRGWVFQERFLSARVLYFGTRQVLWECHEEQKCEVFPLGVPVHHPCQDVDALWDNAEQRSDGALMSISVYNMWVYLVGMYTTCKFKYSSDRLMAFSGIARLFEKVTGDVYVHGMWRSSWVSMLDWRVTKPLPRPVNRPVPSYSWAAVDGEVHIMPKHGYETIPVLEVLWKHSSPDASPFGVRVQGRRLPMSCDTANGAPRAEAKAYIDSVCVDGYVIWDSMDMGERDVYSCVPSMLRGVNFDKPPSEGPTDYACYGLVLQRVSQPDLEGLSFRRVGLIIFDSFSAGDLLMDSIMARKTESFTLV